MQTTENLNVAFFRLNKLWIFYCDLQVELQSDLVFILKIIINDHDNMFICYLATLTRKHGIVKQAIGSARCAIAQISFYDHYYGKMCRKD